MEKSRFFKTKEHGFYRDRNNFSLINTDVEAFKMYKMLRDEKLRVKKLSEEMTSVQDQLNAINSLIKDLANKG